MEAFDGFKRFTNCQRAIDWGLNSLKRQEDSIFQSEMEKPRFYDGLNALTGNNYRILISALWGNTGYDNIEIIMEEIKILNAGIPAFVIPEDIVGYRVTKIIFIKALFGGYCLQRGTIYKYSAFLHASLTFKTAWELARERFPEYNCFMKIYIKR